MPCDVVSWRNDAAPPVPLSGCAQAGKGTHEPCGEVPGQRAPSLASPGSGWYAWLSALPSNPLRGVVLRQNCEGMGLMLTRCAPAEVWMAQDAWAFYAEGGFPVARCSCLYDRSESACANIDPTRLDLSAVDELVSSISPALHRRSASRIRSVREP